MPSNPIRASCVVVVQTNAAQLWENVKYDERVERVAMVIGPTINTRDTEHSSEALLPLMWDSELDKGVTVCIQQHAFIERNPPRCSWWTDTDPAVLHSDVVSCVRNICHHICQIHCHTQREQMKRWLELIAAQAVLCDMCGASVDLGMTKQSFRCVVRPR